MNKDEVKGVVVNVVKEVAETEATEALKNIGTDEIKALVNSAVEEKITELEEDSATSSSWWVKIRNRVEIAFLKASIATIIAEVEQQLAKI